MIRSAKRTIDWACFYVASSRGQALDPVLSELSQAAARGVRVRMIFDKQMAKTDPQALAFLLRMPGAAIRVLDFNLIATGSHHAKYLVVDGELFLGSQNFDWRSLSQIHELGSPARATTHRGTARIFVRNGLCTGAGSQRHTRIESACVAARADPRKSK